MTAHARPRPYPPHRAVSALIERHGGWSILRAVLREILHQHSRRRDMSAPTSDHLRRDIGLKPLPPPPEIYPPPF